MNIKFYFFAFLSFSLLLVSCKKRFPISGFSISSTSVVTGETVTFTNESKNAASYKWEFGDGTESTDEHTTHTYTAHGTYTMTLIAYSKGGNTTSSKDAVITVGKNATELEAEASSELFVNTWALDSMNLDEIDGSTHYNFPLASLWGGTTSYLWVVESPDVLTVYRDGDVESSGTWAFLSATSLQLDGSATVNVLELSSTKFVYETQSSTDPAYMETRYYTVE